MAAVCGHLPEGSRCLQNGAFKKLQPSGRPQPTEHALGGIAVAVEEREKPVFQPVRLSRDIRHRAFRLNLPADGVAVVG
jgi:hypothetical protein